MARNSKKFSRCVRGGDGEMRERGDGKAREGGDGDHGGGRARHRSRAPQRWVEPLIGSGSWLVAPWVATGQFRRSRRRGGSLAFMALRSRLVGGDPARYR